MIENIENMTQKTQQSVIVTLFVYYALSLNLYENKPKKFNQMG
jgi:hypothetical protein